jgi:hypothetical protein
MKLDLKNILDLASKIIEAAKIVLEKPKPKKKPKKGKPK